MFGTYKIFSLWYFMYYLKNMVDAPVNINDIPLKFKLWFYTIWNSIKRDQGYGSASLFVFSCGSKAQSNERFLKST